MTSRERAANDLASTWMTFVRTMMMSATRDGPSAPALASTWDQPHQHVRRGHGDILLWLCSGSGLTRACPLPLRRERQRLEPLICRPSARNSQGYKTAFYPKTPRVLSEEGREPLSFPAPISSCVHSCLDNHRGPRRGPCSPPRRAINPDHEPSADDIFRPGSVGGGVQRRKALHHPKIMTAAAGSPSVNPARDPASPWRGHLGPAARRGPGGCHLPAAGGGRWRRGSRHIIISGLCGIRRRAPPAAGGVVGRGFGVRCRPVPGEQPPQL
jgi:hypothetical protein